MNNFAAVQDLAAYLRQELESKDKEKKYLLLFAYNGTGKTRLSMAFKDLGKKPTSVVDYGNFTDPVTKVIDYGKFSSPADESVDYGNFSGDTLYFNAFTEDLFSWDNDLDGDSQRFLKINSKSRFFAGLEELEMENRIRPFLHRYADFDFRINYNDWSVVFSRDVPHIKVSRGEENMFIWCFFLAIVQLALDGAEAYKWVKYIYIDDPISSLDENNAIKIGHHLAQLIKRKDHHIKTVISSHHTLFFNVMYNELHGEKKKFSPYFLSFSNQTNLYSLRATGDTPFFHHIATLVELYQAAQEDKLYTYHFNILRTILEKSASFHGYKKFSALIAMEEEDAEGVLHSRLINILNHGNYSLYEPREMLEQNKVEFKKILDAFLKNYTFNPELFPQIQQET